MIINVISIINNNILISPLSSGQYLSKVTFQLYNITARNIIQLLTLRRTRALHDNLHIILPNSPRS